MYHGNCGTLCLVEKSTEIFAMPTAQQFQRFKLSHYLKRSQDPKVTKKQLNQLYDQTMLIDLFSAVVVTLMVYLFWGHFTNATLLSWLAFGYINSFGRPAVFLIIGEFLSISQDYSRISLVMIVTQFLSSMIWVFAAILFCNTTHNDVFITTVVAVCCMVAMGYSILATYLPALFAFIVPPLLTLMVVFYKQDNFALLSLAALVLFGASFFSVSINRIITNSIRLDLKNTTLLAAMSKAKDDSEAARQEAEKAREEAIQANQSKSQFLAAASHDLRQPLHSMGLYLDALGRRVSDFGDEEKNMLNKVTLSHYHLCEMFNSLLEVSRLDAGSVEVNRNDIAIKPLLDNLTSELNASASEKGLQLNCQAENLVVNSDSVLLTRVLRNLLNNAIKFTNQGSVNIVARSVGNNIELLISDTGLGIPPAEQKAIFDEYYQLNNPERDRNNGIGLGLSVVKRMCFLLGHRIQLESELGNGSKFTITVPRGDTPLHKTGPFMKITSDMKGMKVLVIDDESDILQGMELMLNDMGCYPMLAENLEQAIAVIENSSQEPDIILSDYRLKDNETGLDVIKTLRKRFNRHFPSFLISGDTDPELLRKIRQEQFMLLHKPIKPVSLQKAVRQLLKDASF